MVELWQGDTCDSSESVGPTASSPDDADADPETRDEESQPAVGQSQRSAGRPRPATNSSRGGGYGSGGSHSSDDDPPKLAAKRRRAGADRGGGPALCSAARRRGGTALVVVSTQKGACDRSLGTAGSPSPPPKASGVAETGAAHPLPSPPPARGGHTAGIELPLGAAMAPADTNTSDVRPAALDGIAAMTPARPGRLNAGQVVDLLLQHPEAHGLRRASPDEIELMLARAPSL